MRWMRVRLSRNALNRGRHRYVVSVGMQGRIVAVVKVQADDEGHAGAKAVRYVAANLYPLRLTTGEP